MKCIGVINSEEDSKVFGDYLFSQGVENQIDRSGDHFEVWILDEDQIEMAKIEYDLFLIQPQHEKYKASVKKARTIRREFQKTQKESLKRQIHFQSRFTVRAAKMTRVLIVVSLVMFLLQGLIVNIENLFYFYLPAIEIGQIWRLVTPIFMHGGILHLIFNMWWLHDFGGIIESKKGPKQFLILVFVVAAVSNYVQYTYSGPFFLGMSGVNYGLLGYIWIKMKYQPYEGIGIEPSTFYFLMVWLFLCMLGVFGSIANGTHIAGLITGGVYAYLPYALNRYQRRK